MAKMVKTRLCIISDTHTRAPKPHSCAQYAYREPLPKADVLLHAGDLTMTGGVAEYEVMLNVFRKAEAEVKIVIAGNHDITLDEDFYNQSGKMIYHRNEPQDLEKVREMWTGNHAKEAGIIYLEEGIRTFTLHNGATFTLYSSPWQPAYDIWAFNYFRSTDRFNPSPPVASVKAMNPVPPWPQIDLMLTHGPPYGIRDTTWADEEAGCQHLRRAVQRSRPRLHCFGHIHEGWGAEKMRWSTETSETIETNDSEVLEQGFAFLDLTESGKSPLRFGEETMFVNAAIMNRKYSPVNAPWVVDLDLPLAIQPTTDSAVLNV